MAEGNKPDYNVRARDHRDRKIWNTVGVAWNSTSRDGVPFISVRLHSIPINWDGSMVLVDRNNEQEPNGE